MHGVPKRSFDFDPIGEQILSIQRLNQKKNQDKDVVKNMNLMSIFNTVNKAVKEGMSPEEAINKESNKIDKELENANKQKEILENNLNKEPKNSFEFN